MKKLGERTSVTYKPEPVSETIRNTYHARTEGPIMNGLLQFVNRLNLVSTFLILFAAHGLLYFGLDNGDWFFLALSASLVWTGVIAFVQLFTRGRSRSK
jgi:hypothetical protein